MEGRQHLSSLRSRRGHPEDRGAKLRERTEPSFSLRTDSLEELKQRSKLSPLPFIRTTFAIPRQLGVKSLVPPSLVEG